nr:hypothetical protein [Tanacetum cinerariifolium]
MNKLKVSKLRRLKKVSTSHRVDTSEDTVMDDVSKQEEIIANIDADKDVTLKDVAVVAKEVEDDELEPTELQEIVTTAKLMIKVVTVTSATITTATTPITAATLTTDPSAARRRKGVVIGVPEETVTPSIIIHFELKSKDKGKWILVKEPKPIKKNMAGFKMDYFKGLSYDDIRPIFEKYFNSNVAFLEKTKEQLEKEESIALKRKTKSQAKKATKKQKLDEEVPVVDYEIYTENKKPYYKIIRADESPQLFLSFLSILRNFDREDLEVIWQLVKERFASSKPKNFLDDFLLTTLTYMFEKPDNQAQVWNNQRTVHGLAKRGYPLTRFTLDQLLKNVRLEVKEESEVSLELLKFIRQQQQEGFRPETGLGYDSQMNKSDLNDVHGNESQVIGNSLIDSHESVGEDNQVNDRFKKSERYHAVPPSYTRNYMPPRADLSFVGLDDPVFKSKESDSEDENVVEKTVVKKTVKLSLEKIKFVNTRNTTIENESKAEKPRKLRQSPRVNTTRPKAVINLVRMNQVNDVKASACWVWRPIKPNSASITLKRYDYVDVRGRSKSEMA